MIMLTSPFQGWVHAPVLWFVDLTPSQGWMIMLTSPSQGWMCQAARDRGSTVPAD